MKEQLNKMAAKQQQQKSTRDRMKEFERFLKYDGVDHLAYDQKKIYHSERHKKIVQRSKKKEHKLEATKDKLLGIPKERSPREEVNSGEASYNTLSRKLNLTFEPKI